MKNCRTVVAVLNMRRVSKKNVIYSTKNTHAEDRKIEGNLWVCTYMRKNGNKSIKYERGFFVGLLRTI